ncbi:hypothetical protein P7C70_g9233, partial [Phenoliferia sp. Uapishka_3]
MQTTITSLPFELILSIAEVSYCEDRSAMSLVCKSWLDPARQALFGEVDFWDPATSIERIAQWRESPCRERYPSRSISLATSLMPDEASLRLALESCSGLRELSLMAHKMHASWAVLLCPQLSTLRSLSLVACGAIGFEDPGQKDQTTEPRTLPFQLEKLSLGLDEGITPLLISSLFHSSRNTLSSLTLDLNSDTALPAFVISLPLVANRIKHLHLPGRLRKEISPDLSFLSTLKSLETLTLSSVTPTIGAVAPHLPPTLRQISIVTLESSITNMVRALLKALPKISVGTLERIEFPQTRQKKFDVAKHAALINAFRDRKILLGFSDGWIIPVGAGK